MDPTEVTRELVSIPSHDGEAAAGDYIESWLRDHTDGRVVRDDAGDDDRGGNVIAYKGSGDTTVALVGHHDVVPPDDSQLEGDDYVVSEEDGRLYGRGSADMKGAVAASMCAFRDAEPPEGVEVAFMSLVGEEVGGIGADAVIDRGDAPDYALVGEGSTSYSAPGVTNVGVAHKGRRGSTITAEGSAAHASEPEAGENAIYRASDAIDVLRAIEFPEAEVMGHEVSGSVVATEIEGGTAWNVIPEECSVTVDERTVPGERAPLERVESVEGVTWDVVQDLPPMECDDPAFADAVLDVARDVQSDAAAEPEHFVKPQATDAGWLARAGTSCVICGPSEPGEAHTKDESVSFEVLENCYDIYLSVAESWTA